MLKLIIYFRMPKHVRSHPEKDDPRPTLGMEDDCAYPSQDGADLGQDLVNNPTNLTYQIEEAMEEEGPVTAQASQVEEGDAGSTASSLNGLPKGGGYPDGQPMER